MTSSRATFALLIGLTLLGFWLRVFQLGESNFRGDEAFTVQYWIMPPLDVALAQYTTLDPQPPLAYISYNLWGRLVGRSEFAVRVLPALASVLSIALMFRLAQRVFHQKLYAPTATLLWTLHPFVVFHAQDARNYALWSAMSLAGVWLALRALERGRPLDWVVYVTVAAAAGYLYYLEMFIYIALSLFVAIAYWQRWRIYVKWGAAMSIVGLLLAPWYLQPRIRSGGGYTGTTSGFDLERLLTDFPRVLVFGETAPSLLPGSVGLLIIALLLSGWILTAWYQWRPALLLGVVGGVPLVLLGFLSTQLDILQPRYVLASVPAITLTGTAGICWLLNHRKTTRLIGGGLLMGWLLLNIIALHNYYTAYSKAPDWRALAGYLAESTTADDLVIQTAVDPAFGYYYNDVYAVAAPEQALPASPNQPKDDIEAALSELSGEYSSVWLAAQGFTDWPSYGVVEAWMSENMQLVVDTNAANLRAEQYMPWQVSPDEITVEEPLALFGDVVEVVDIRVIQPVLPTGEQVIWVYWRPLVQTQTQLKAFVHLSGELNPQTGNPLWSQADQEPQQGRAVTTQWEPGSLYRDVYILPGVASLPNGEYNLSLGLYDPQTGERLMTTTGEDAYRIGTLTRP